MDFGVTFSRTFVDAQDRRKSRKRPKNPISLMNLHNNEAGRKVSPPCPVWYGMICSVIFWYGMVGYGIICSGISWYGTVWYGRAGPTEIRDPVVTTRWLMRKLGLGRCMIAGGGATG